MDTAHPFGAVARQKLEMRTEVRVVRLRVNCACRWRKMVAPELDVRLERRELRALAPIDGEPRRKDQPIERQPAACRIEQHTAVADERGADRAARDDREVLVPATA